MLNDHFSEGYEYHFFLPTIVTTAQLYVCKFEDNDIRLDDGEIPIDKAKLVPYPYVVFNYPIPYSLQTQAAEVKLDAADRPTSIQLARLPIFVVQSESFPIFLESVESALLRSPNCVQIQFPLNISPHIT